MERYSPVTSANNLLFSVLRSLPSFFSFIQIDFILFYFLWEREAVNFLVMFISKVREFILIGTTVTEFAFFFCIIRNINNLELVIVNIEMWKVSFITAIQNIYQSVDEFIYLFIYLTRYTHIHTHTHTHRRGVFNRFPDIFFVQAFKIVVDSWKFNMLLLHILWDDWAIFIISGLNEQLQQQLKYTLLKSDCHSWWISKIQSGLEDTLEERYAIKFCFNLEKMPQKRMECFRLLFNHLSWIKHQFLSGIRDSRKTGSLWGMMRGVGGVRKSIH